MGSYCLIHLNAKFIIIVIKRKHKLFNGSKIRILINNEAPNTSIIGYLQNMITDTASALSRPGMQTMDTDQGRNKRLIERALT